MAGRITISTLNNDTGVLATQNGMTGIAKAWVSFTNSSGTLTIQNSFNVSSLTYKSTGLFNVAFTTAMPNATYALVGVSCTTGVAGGSLFIKRSTSTTTNTDFETVSTTSSGSPVANLTENDLAIFST
jgi:hypothetical protein